MITSYLLHPSLFGPDIQKHSRELKRLLKILLNINGALLIDRQAMIVKKYYAMLDSLSDHLKPMADEIRRYLDLLILQDSGQAATIKHVVKCKINAQDDNEVVGLMALKYLPDSIVVSDTESHEVNQKALREGWHGLPVPLSRLEDSEIEKRRESEREAQHLEMMGITNVKEKIFRLLRYARKIQFYDPYFAAEAPSEYFDRRPNTWSEIEKWRLGIEFILDIVERESLMKSTPVKIVFVSKRKSTNFRTDHAGIQVESQSERMARRDAESRAAAIHFHNTIILPIAEIYKNQRMHDNWIFEYRVKEAKDAFRSRYLSTEYAIVKVDKGFDLFLPGTGMLRENEMAIANDQGSQKKLQSWDELPEMELGLNQLP